MARIIVSFDGDNIGQQVGRATLADDIEAVRRIDNKIRQGQDLWIAWAQRSGGSLIEAGGDEGRIEIESSALPEIEDIRRQYESLVGSTVTVGVGNTLSESAKALLVGKIRGKNRTVVYDETVAKEYRDLVQQAETQSAAKKLIDEYILRKTVGMVAPDEGVDGAGEMGRTAGMVAPHEMGNLGGDEPWASPDEGSKPQHDVSTFEEAFHRAAQEQSAADRAANIRTSKEFQALKERLAEALKNVKEQIPAIREAGPEVHQAVLRLIQSVIDLARGVKESEEELAKAERRRLKWTDGWVTIPAHGTPQRATWDLNFRLAIEDQIAGGPVSLVHLPVDALRILHTIPEKGSSKIKMYRQMARHDRLPPVYVSGWTVLDGHHRLAAAKMEGLKTVPAYVLTSEEHKYQTQKEKTEREPHENPPAPTELDKSRGLPVGTVDKGKVKVRHADGKIAWKSVRAGMVQAQEPGTPLFGANSHPVSSRNPTGR